MAPKRKTKSKASKKPAPPPPPEDEEAELDDGAAPAAPGDDDASDAGAAPAESKAEKRRKKRGAPAPPAPEDADEMPCAAANKRRKFKLYVDEASGRYATDPEPCPAVTAQPFEGGAKDKEAARAEALADSELQGLVKKMARYLLMRGTKRLPIVKNKLGDAVMGDYKKLRITSYVLHKACEDLKKTWGYELVAAPPKCGDMEFKGQAKDSFYLVHARKRRTAHAANLAGVGLDKGDAAARGLLLAVLSVVQAASGAVRERELYRLLHDLDERLPDEPPKKASSSKGGAGDLTSLPAHLEAFVAMQYLVSYKDAEDETAYALGPRALVDVGRFQIAQFSADALKHETVDASIVEEIGDAVRPDPDAAPEEVAASQ